MRISLAASAFALLLPALALADGVEPDASTPACPRAPDHDKGIAMGHNMAEQIDLYGKVDWSTRRSLGNWVDGVEQVRQAAGWLPCDHPSFSPKELADARALEARALRWADAMQAVLSREQKARDEIVLPLCEAVWGAQNAEAVIAHEKSNPSGVVDLKALHDAGESLQYYRAQIAGLKPLYRKARGRGFTKWQDEGVCAEAAEKPQ